MTHFGIICPSSTGHLNPMTTLGYELQKRGYRVTVLGVEDAKPKVLAARIAWTGTGEVIPLGKVSVEKLQKAIKQVLTEDSYKKNALRLEEAIRRSGGVSRAADIIEQAVSTGQPVLA